MWNNIAYNFLLFIGIGINCLLFKKIQLLGGAAPGAAAGAGCVADEQLAEGSWQWAVSNG